MKAPVSRRRGKRPVLAPRTMDLLGVGRDGNLYVWSEACQVQPLDRFPVSEAGRIIAGHYVLERNGKAVTAHIGSSLRRGFVDVQYMCGGGFLNGAEQKVVEGWLLGRYVPDPKQEAEISAALQQLLQDQEARQTAPHRRRGLA